MPEHGAWVVVGHTTLRPGCGWIGRVPEHGPWVVVGHTTLPPTTRAHVAQVAQVTQVAQLPGHGPQGRLTNLA